MCRTPAEPSQGLRFISAATGCKPHNVELNLPVMRPQHGRCLGYPGPTNTVTK